MSMVLNTKYNLKMGFRGAEQLKASYAAIISASTPGPLLSCHSSPQLDLVTCSAACWSSRSFVRKCGSLTKVAYPVSTCGRHIV